MKKIFIGLIIFFMFFSLFTQDWKRDLEFENNLETWDVYLEVWILEKENMTTFNFEDITSENFWGIREQLTGLMFVLMNSTNNVITDHMDYIIYSWFEYEDPTDSSARYNDKKLRWDIHMDYDWLVKYSLTKRSIDKRNMISLLINSIEAQWQDVNNLYLKKDLEQFEETIKEQRKLELDYIPKTF